MEHFTESLKAVLKQKIIEKSENQCFGCVLGAVDDSDHFCRSSLTENTERFFNQVFSAYAIRNRIGIIERLKVALCEEILAEGLDRPTAQSIAHEQCAERSLMSVQLGEVSSSTPLPPPRPPAAVADQDDQSG